MKKIGIIGAGHMGSGIAQKTAQEGLHTLKQSLDCLHVFTFNIQEVRERGMT